MKAALIPIPGDVGPLQYAMPALNPIGQLHPESRPPEKWVLIRPDAIGVVLAVVVVGILLSDFVLGIVSLSQS